MKEDRNPKLTVNEYSSKDQPSSNDWRRANILLRLNFSVFCFWSTYIFLFSVTDQTTFFCFLSLINQKFSVFYWSLYCLFHLNYFSKFSDLIVAVLNIVLDHIQVFRWQKDNLYCTSTNHFMRKKIKIFLPRPPGD